MTSGGDGDVLADIWSHSEEIMRGRVAALEDAARAVLSGSLDVQQRRFATQEAHKLAGSLGSFGLAEGSRLASEVEWLMRGSTPPQGESALRLSELIVALGAELAAGPTRSRPAGDDNRADGPAVLVVDGDVDFGYRMIEQAAALRLRPAVVPSTVAARTRIATSRPDLIVLDPASAGESDGGRALLTELCRPADPIATLVVTTPGEGVTRAEAARLGCRGYLAKPVPPQKVAEVADRLLNRVRREQVVLVVGAPATARILVGASRASHWRVHLVEDPGHFWTALNARRPDLLVLDINSSTAETARLCRMARGDPEWDRLPIVVVTDAPAEQRTELFRAGVDDVVVKPATADDLVARTVNRLERTPDRRGEPEQSVGPERLPHWERDLRRLLAIAARHRQPVTVGLLAADTGRRPPGAPPSAPVAQQLLSRLLAQALPLEDLVSEREDRHLVVAMYGVRPAEAAERLAAVLTTYRVEHIAHAGEPATASAGLAAFPEDGYRAAALLDWAEKALAAAQAAGGDRVRSGPGGAGSARAGRTVDVLLVDDDEALTPLLVHALTTRGYRTHWIKEGAEAAALLLAPDGLRARVILLDVGLPGLDGLSVLRKLAEAGILDSTRVIMLTLRSAEREVLQALELGAFDHVAKPVSIPLLMRWVRRAIESL